MNYLRNETGSARDASRPRLFPARALAAGDGHRVGGGRMVLTVHFGDAHRGLRKLLF